MTDSIGSLQDLARQVREATGAVRSDIATIDTRLHELHGERALLTDSMVSLDDLMQYVEKKLDADAESYLHQMQMAVEKVPFSFGQLERGFINNFPLESGDIYRRELSAGAISYVLRDSILSGFRRVLEATVKFPERNIPVAKRRKEIARIDGEIEMLKNRRQELVETLDEVVVGR